MNACCIFQATNLCLTNPSLVESSFYVLYHIFATNRKNEVKHAKTLKITLAWCLLRVFLHTNCIIGLAKDLTFALL